MSTRPSHSPADRNKVLNCPPIASPDLREARLPSRDSHEVVRQNLSFKDLEQESATWETNRKRIEQLKESGFIRPETDSAYCYKAEAGWIVEMRYKSVSPEQLDSYLKVTRIRESILSEPGKDLLLRRTDRRAGINWNAALRYLESETNVVISAQTGQNPHGYFAGAPEGEGRNPPLVGHGLQDQQVTALRLTKLHRPLVTQASQEPSHREQGLRFVHSHAMAMAEFDGKEWSKTSIIPSSRIAAKGADSTALQYAQTGFEGTVVEFDGEDSIAFFRIDQNYERFAGTMLALGVKPLSEAQFLLSIEETVKQNLAYVPRENGRLYVRPYLLGMEGGAGASAAQRYIFGVEVFPMGDYFVGSDAAIAVEACLTNHRPDTGASKLGANYGPGFKHKAEVKSRGYHDFLSFDRNGKAEELSSCAVFFIEENTKGELSVVTPLVQTDIVAKAFLGEEASFEKRNILDSITRRSVLDLAQIMNIPVEVRDIDFLEIKNMAGAFCAGTAVGITRIESIDLKGGPEFQLTTLDASVNFSDHSGATQMIEKLRELLRTARTGNLEGDFAHLNEEWVTKVKVDPAVLAD